MQWIWYKTFGNDWNRALQRRWESNRNIVKKRNIWTFIESPIGLNKNKHQSPATKSIIMHKTRWFRYPLGKNVSLERKKCIAREANMYRQREINETSAHLSYAKNKDFRAKARQKIRLTWALFLHKSVQMHFWATTHRQCQRLRSTSSSKKNTTATKTM